MIILIMKRLLFLIATLVCTTVAKTQPDCFFTHYSSEDGLSQNTVMSILQDRKGFLWFATWNGLNKFDGYTFKTYRADWHHPDHTLTNNRIDQIEEDCYGYLWLLTYDSRAFRFDPRMSQFECVPAQGEPGCEAAISSIRVLPGGAVWLLTEKEGAFRVGTEAAGGRMDIRRYSEQAQSSERLVGKVRTVCEDKAGNEWILTDKGLMQLVADDKHQATLFFAGSPGQQQAEPGQGFYACREWGDRLYFGSDDGKVWCYHPADKQFQLLQLPATSPVVALEKAGEAGLLAATATDGLFLYSSHTDPPEHYSMPQLTREPVHSLYVDCYGEAWIEQHIPGTITHFNLVSHTFKTEQIAVEPTCTDRSRPSFHVHEDCHGNVWVHPYGGGFSRFDPATRSLLPFYNNLQDGEWRFSNKIHSAYSDRQGNLWLCTHSKGVEKITFHHSPFRLFTPVPRNYETLSNEVRALCEDGRGRLWVGLKDGRLRVYDADRTELGYLTEAGTLAHTGLPLRGNVYFLKEDSHGNLWIATKGDGLVKAVLRADGNYTLTRYRHSKEDIYSLSDDDVYCVHEDSRGRIWVATFGGGVNYLERDSATGDERFINCRNHLKNYPINDCYKVRFITGDNQGHVWIGTPVGALRADEQFSRPEELLFHRYTRIPGDPTSLSNNDVHWISATSRGELYLGTFGGGLNKLEAIDAEGLARFKCYLSEKEVTSDILLSIREDVGGNLWMSTVSGISKFTPSTGQFENYNTRDLSHSVRFSEAASAYTRSGHLLFGTTYGIFSFHPDSVRKSRYVPSLVFSGLLVDNEEVAPGEAAFLPRALDDVRRLKLSHRENVFTIQFAALDYSAPTEVNYAYMLEGFEKNWNYVGRQRSATYTNLPKGKYLFKVRSTNADGVWVDNVRTLPVEMMPVFWETPLAYLLYVLLILLIIVTTVYILFTIYRLKHRVVVEQELTNMKLRFFTDVSHELRTPLTLISGPVECVLEQEQLSSEAREQLLVVKRNAGRMLRLINQILDFRKIQNRKMKMRVQRLDVVAFTRKIMANFDSVAEEHRIDFLFETECAELYLWLDADKYEKIVYNLLSNAFKFTPNDKMIKVFIHEDEQTVAVGVQDQGIGIAENKRNSLFVRFENLVDRNLFNQFNSGIGLSLVKELVEMHKAVITVDSKVGKGSCFCVSFRKGKEHYDESTEFLQDDATASLDEVASAEVLPAATTGAATTDAPLTETPPVRIADEDPSKETLLLVEDNAELRLFLRSILAADYRIVEAVDGEQGESKALEFLPDLIISDLMMSRKDGLTMLRELRANLTTSHIPVILLTAKSSIEHQMEGLESGAEAYITKPFSAAYLKVRVKSLLARRQFLRELYRERLMPSVAPQPSDPSLAVTTEAMAATPSAETTADTGEAAHPAAEPTPQMSAHDRKFMDKLLALMEKNMDNGDLVVDDLVRELAVSRSVFFKKLKTLTGLAPVEFIKEMRINRAVELIATGDYTMTQISYMVGINDSRYFSKCFKQKMGMTPTEYKEKLRSSAS